VELIRFVDDLQRQLITAAEAGGDDSRALAQRLLAPLEASVRLVLLDALSAAAQEITSELAPGSVDLRLRGLNPEFVVTSPVEPEGRPEPAAGASAPVAVAVAVAAAEGDGDEGAMARITLRLPEPVKQRIEQAAARSGVSVNSWLAAAATNALGPQEVVRQAGVRTVTGGHRVTGWAR
jgi:hypothetical protein